MKFLLIAAVFVFNLLFLRSAEACPLCKEAFEKMGRIWASIGFNLSIYFMIAVPFLIVGSFGLVLYFYSKKHSKT